MRVIILGSGMYVCGRGTNEFGTIVPGIVEYYKVLNQQKPLELIIFWNSFSGFEEAITKISEIELLSNVKIEIIGHCINDLDIELLKYNPKNTPVILALPDHLHYSYCRKLLTCGFSMLVVKPFVEKVFEGIELIKLANQQNVLAMVEFHKRLDKANLVIRESLINNEIGEILTISVEYSQRISIPLTTFIKWASESNPLQYLGVHYVDMVRFLTNATPIRVMSIGQKKTLINQGLDTYDCVDTIVVWRDIMGKEFNQILHTNWIDPMNTTAMSDQKIKIIGTRGRIESNQKDRGLTIINDSKNENPNPDFNKMYHVGDDVVWRGYGIDSIKQFLEDYRLGPLCWNLEGKSTFSESIYSTMVVEASNASLNNNSKWIEIKH